MRVTCTCGISFEADGNLAVCPGCANELTIATDSPGVRPMCPTCGEAMASIDAICETCHPAPFGEECEYVAWEDRSRPLLARWWKSFWNLETVPAAGSLRSPFLFVLFSQFLFWAAAAVVLLALTAIAGKGALIAMVGVVALALPLLFAITAVTMVLWSSVLHALLRRAGGVGDFGATWRCCCYSASMFFIPGTSLWIRGAVALIVLLLSTCSLYRAHRISWIRTALAGLIPAVVLMGPALLKPLVGYTTARLREAGVIDLAPTMPRSVPDKSLTADQRKALRGMRDAAARGQAAILAAIVAVDEPALRRERKTVLAACDAAIAAVPASPEPHYWRARTLRLCGDDSRAVLALARITKSESIYLPHVLERIFQRAATHRLERRGRLDRALRGFVLVRARDAADGLDLRAAPPILRDLVTPAEEAGELATLGSVAGAFDAPSTGVSEEDRQLVLAIGCWARGDVDGARAALGAATSSEAAEIGATLDIETGNYAAALNRLEEALIRAPGHGGLRKLLSLARMAEGLRAGDATVIRRAVDDAEPPVAPVTQAIHLKLRAAMARLVLGDWARVIADLKDETLQSHIAIRGTAQLLAGDAAAAGADFGAMLADLPENEEARLRRGDARAARGAWGYAIADYDAVAGAGRSRAWALSRWAASDPSKRRDAAAAWGAFDDPVALVHRGDVSDAAEALRCFELAAQASPVLGERLQARIEKARAQLK